MRSRTHRLANQINAGSMADIAFLLLIFFLVATTISEDQGIMVKLPPIVESPVVTPPGKNVLSVKINAQNQLMIEGLPANIGELRERTKYFILNPDQRDDMPDNPKRAIISLQNDRSTSYNSYLRIYNELKAAYNEIWAEKSKQKYGKMYEGLTKSQQRNIRNQVPLVISEAESSDYKNSK